MRGRGITYDTGFWPGGRSSRITFDPDAVREDMAAIAGDLRCTAVRITGGDVERLTVAAGHAAAVGLEVWFSPFLCELTPEQMMPVLEECARRAEEVRAGGAEVVLVLGCEITLFASGFLPGSDVFERLAAVVGGDPALLAEVPEARRRMKRFLADAAGRVRGHFGGRVTYAAGDWEDVDWSVFDIVAVDAYRHEGNADGFREQVRGYGRHGKPVAVTEFGCCTYVGAGDRGGMGWAILDHDADPPVVEAGHIRSEAEQVRYLEEVLDVFADEGVDSAFWYTFAGFELPHVPGDPERDLDMSSFGVVRILPEGGGWEPKEVSQVMAARYAMAAATPCPPADVR